MGILKKLFRFFIYSNLYIAGCAVVMACQAYQLLSHRRPDFTFLSFVFFATLCSYSFHWFLESGSVLSSPRIDWQRRHYYLHLGLFVTGLIGSGVCFLYLIDHWFWLSFSAIITFLYSAPKIPHPYFRMLRKVAIGKTIFLAFVWMYVTSVLPAIVSEMPKDGKFYLFAVSRFFLIYAICILFDYRDRADDKVKGIKSLITWLSDRGIHNLFVFSLIVFAAATLALAYFGVSWPFVALLLVPGAITIALYGHAKRNFSDLVYYFILDGLMALSSVLTLIAGI
jgi:4-hydroxybenzoate polyprenyltransferase